MLAVCFQAMRLALNLLCPERPPSRGEISIVSGHPGPGVRDAFEFISRAATRGAYRVDRGLPAARLAAGADMSYSFQIRIGDARAVLALRREVLPDRFFALNSMPSRTLEHEAELSRLKRSIATRVLATAPDQLFDVGIEGGTSE